MSFKIFTLQLFGKIKTIASIEKKRQQLLDSYNIFTRVEKSEELRRYMELERKINSQEFKKEKSEIQSLIFKGSKEYNQLKELKKLKSSKGIKNYLKVEVSEELKRYKQLAASDKIKEFDQLSEYVKEGQFVADKKSITSQVFKGSAEEKHMRDFKRLDKSAGIKAYKSIHQSARLKKHEQFSESEKLKKYIYLTTEPLSDKQKQKELKTLKRDTELRGYFRFEKSKMLKLYREVAGSHELKKYEDLSGYINSGDYKERVNFLKDQKKFKKSEAYKKFSRFKNLAADNDVKFFLKFDKSARYKNYLDVNGSHDLKRYNELLELTNSEEFKKRKAYLEDKNKWLKSPGYAVEQEMLTLRKQPDMEIFFSNKGNSAYNFFRNWEVVFEDDFSAVKPDINKWSGKSWLAEKMVGENYAPAGDLQVYTDMENVKTEGGKLIIEARKEKRVGKIWQMPVGFVPVELNYTSGILSSWPSFWQEDGIFEAKIKFNPVNNTIASFCLLGENNLPRLNLLEMGAKNRVGILSSNGKKIVADALDISNLKKGEWYIFTVEKTGSNIVWKINETEVYSTKYKGVDEKLHLHVSLLLIDEIPASVLPVAFQVGWVRCYRKKQG
ncbi:MAG: hypothetical protein CR996_01855 [Draconibacterium sp.]|nr:MAG: hypothetical protein CR996_01855 [Draconibacterium sp.]PIF06018.1 MAG: hypothetical protein CSA36_03775 [Draconibacterium sp.]